jgi:hypothetical protein
VLKPACCRAESAPSALNMGGRRSREAAQPLATKSVTAWPFPLPRGAARLTGVGSQRRRRQRGGAYVRKAVYRRAESDSTPLDIGCKKGREAGVQPRGAKSVTAWPFPLPRSAAKLTAIGGQRRWRQRGGAYVRKAANRRAESDSAPLNAGGRKSRRAGTRPRCATSVKLSSFAAAKKRCHAHSVCQTALQASKWQVRIC